MYFWCDFQTCTPSDHKEQEHGVHLGGPEQLLGVDLTSSLNSLAKIVLLVRFSDLYPFRPQRTVTCCPLSVQLCESDKKYPYLNHNNSKRGGAGDSKFKWELPETWYYIAKVRNPANGESQTPFGPNMCENSLNRTEKHLIWALSKIYNSKRGGNGDFIFEWGVKKMYFYTPKLRKLADGEDQGPFGNKNLKFARNRSFLGPILHTFWVVTYTFLGVNHGFMTI